MIRLTIAKPYLRIFGDGQSQQSVRRRHRHRERVVRDFVLVGAV